MNLAAMERSTWRNPNAVRMAERFSLALLRYAFWHRGEWCLPVETLLGAIFPRLFAQELPPPTKAKPRTPEKLMALAERWIEGLSLWNPDDAKLDGDDVLQGPRTRTNKIQRNGSKLARQTHRGLEPA